MKHLNTFNEASYKSLAFDFRKVSKPKVDQLYLLLHFEGGDADTRHPVQYRFSKDVKYSNYQNHMFEIDRIIGDFKDLKDALNVNSRDYCKTYKDVKEKFGQDVADLYDGVVPNDPQGDFQFKCYLDSMELVGYDESGTEYRSYIS